METKQIEDQRKARFRGLTSKELKDLVTIRKDNNDSWAANILALLGMFSEPREYSVDQLREIVHGLTDRWPHSVDRFALSKMAACSVEMFHYKAVFKAEPKESLQQYWDEVRFNAVLKPFPPVDEGKLQAEEDVDLAGELLE